MGKLCGERVAKLKQPSWGFIGYLLLNLPLFF
uniref:Uncharacterized protein n=1 Tax=Anguilla anguilla TaxID=7936 RepID=A0A0E9UCN9_ANGAN